ncbi:hypothetical protein EG68_10836 [Paragonimus skrjabini miyazakii]|uniref:Uncharacterized protein n=1 Tax=Paragonimus skrjabini miyazakii TaxID=59628 RepID=A0A8S9YKB0_9TREM|nr:hypothetical protein EG68_10836 [Paragonimus skrjabini miyazakii]
MQYPVSLTSPTISTPTDVVSWEERDSYEDPQMHFDPLPMPYRMIDEMVGFLFDLAWEIILQRQHSVELTNSIFINLDDDDTNQTSAHQRIDRLHLFCVTENLIITSIESNIFVWDRLNDKLVDQWTANGVDIRTLSACSFTPQLTCLLATDDLGRGYLLLTVGWKIMLIKMISSMEELKPFYVLTGKFAQNRSICSMIIEDATNHETWIEVFRLPIDRWIKETQPFLELSVNMEPEYPEISDLQSGSTEVIRSNDAMWDRLQLTHPTLMCRIRMPNSLTATQPKSLSNVLRQVADKTATLFPANTFTVGTHLFSDSSLEWRRNEFINSRGYPECLLRPPEPEGHEPEVPTIIEAQKVIRSVSTVTVLQDATEAVTRKDSSIAKSPANKSNQRDGVSPKHKPTPTEGKNASSKKHKGAVGKTKPTPTVSNIDVDPKKSNTPSEPIGTAEIQSDPASHVTEPKIVIDVVTDEVEINSMAQSRQAIDNEYINALCDEANSEKYKGYPRYEFLPVCEPTSEEQRFTTKTNITSSKLSQQLSCLFQLSF